MESQEIINQEIKNFGSFENYLKDNSLEFSREALASYTYGLNKYRAELAKKQKLNLEELHDKPF